jgi:hypothetical protein
MVWIHDFIINHKSPQSTTRRPPIETTIMISGLPALLHLAGSSVMAFTGALAYTYTTSVHRGNGCLRGFPSRAPPQARALAVLSLSVPMWCGSLRDALLGSPDPGVVTYALAAAAALAVLCRPGRRAARCLPIACACVAAQYTLVHVVGCVRAIRTGGDQPPIDQTFLNRGRAAVDFAGGMDQGSAPGAGASIF